MQEITTTGRTGTVDAHAIIMAGGNGERFWPMSTAERPKQFLSLFEGKPLIRHAVDRLEGLIPPERIHVVTSDRFIAHTHAALPTLPIENIVGEPCRRDTAAAAATACGVVLRAGGPDAVGCILTADQLIGPVPAFQRTLADAIATASRTDAIVTMGIPPTRPDTGFGYIEEGEPAATGTETVFRHVKRFVEKPDEATAARYVADGGFLWNSGMFVWKAATMRAAFREHAPDVSALLEAVAAADDVKRTIDRLYPDLRSISLDFAVMERVRDILVAESRFTWDDVGSWAAVEHHFPQDESGNTAIGRAVVANASSSVVVNAGSAGHVVVAAGLKDVVVVHTPTATLVCRKSELKNMKALVAAARSL